MATAYPPQRAQSYPLNINQVIDISLAVVYNPEGVFALGPPNTSETQLAAAIANLGEARLPKVLNRWLQTELRHDNTTIIAYFSNSPPKPILLESAHPTVHENFGSVYLAGAYLLDPFYDLFRKNVAAGVYRLNTVAPDNFKRNQYYLEYYRNTNMVDEIAFVSYPSPGVSLHISLGRDGVSKRRYSARDMQNANRIAPIVTALAANHWGDMALAHAADKGGVAVDLIRALKHERRISLSNRQAEIAMLILQGHSSVSIGLNLGISFQTVKVHRKQLYRKCGISSQAELFRTILPVLGALAL